MNHIAPAAGPAAPPPSLGAADPLADIRRIAANDLAPLAGRIDHEGLYPREVMQKLGAAGAFSAHLAALTPLPERSLFQAIEAMAAIGAVCMSTAFCAWCQDACGWYLENSGNTGLRERLQSDVGRAIVLGGTGLSNPVKALSGIERFKLRASRAAGGYVVSGVLPWVSNLGDDHWFGTIFEDADKPEHRLMAMVRCGQPGVEIRQNARFIALEGTGTYSVLFRRAFIPDDQMLADPLGEMVKRIKPGFILLQTGMGLGVIQGCITLMREFDTTLGASNRYLPRRAEHFAEDLAALTGRIAALAATPLESTPDYMRGVFQARLAVSELALEAAQAALLHAGSRGYIEGSAVSRRLRESYFVAIITPSIRHLRQELDRLSQN